MDARNSFRLGRPGDAWMARHGLSLTTAFKPGLPVVQSFDDPSDRSPGDALWRNLGFQIEPCATRSEAALRTHRWTYQKAAKVDPDDAFFPNGRPTPEEMLNMPKEFWYERCLHCGTLKTWLRDKPHNWRSCTRSCWFCQSKAHLHEPCQGPFRRTIADVRQVIVAIPPGLEWYERNTRPQTPPGSPTVPMQALPEKTCYPAVDAHENNEEPEAMSLFSISPSSDGKDQEDLREVVVNAPAYITEDEEIILEYQPQSHLDASCSYNGAGLEGPGLFSHPQPFNMAPSCESPSGVEGQNSGFVSHSPPLSTMDDYQEVVQSVEWDSALESDSRDPKAMEFDSGRSSSPQTVICIDSEHDDSDDHDSEEFDNEDDSEDDKEYISPEFVDSTASPSPCEGMQDEGYAPEPEASLQHDDEDMSYCFDEIEDQESGGSSERRRSSEQDDKVTSSDTILPDDVDMENAPSYISMPNQPNQESYHFSNKPGECLSSLPEDVEGKAVVQERVPSHASLVVCGSLSPLQESAQRPSLAMGSVSHQLGDLDRNTPSPLNDFPEPFHPSPAFHSDISPLPEYIEGTPVTADEDGFSEEVDILPVRPEVTGAINQAWDLPRLNPETESRLVLGSDQDPSFVSAVEYMHQPTKFRLDPQEPSLQFSEELHSALSHFYSSPPVRGTPGSFVARHDKNMIHQDQTRGEQRELHSTPVARSYVWNTNAGESYYQTPELESTAKDYFLNDNLLLHQQLEAEQQIPLPQDNQDPNWSPNAQKGLSDAPTAAFAAPGFSTPLDHATSSSQEKLGSDANKKDDQSNEMDPTKMQPKSDLTAHQIVQSTSQSSRIRIALKGVLAQCEVSDDSDQASGSSESEDGGVSLVPSGGKTWNMDALEDYYRARRDLERFLKGSSSSSAEESDDEETGTVRHSSAVPGEESDGGGTEVIHSYPQTSEAESEAESDAYERYDADAETDDEGNEHRIERPRHDRNSMAGLYEDDNVKDKMQYPAYVAACEDDVCDGKRSPEEMEAYEDGDCEDYKQSDESSDTYEDDQDENFKWTIFTQDTVARLDLGDSETSSDTEMEEEEEEEEEEDKPWAAKSTEVDSNEETRIPEWLLTNQNQASPGTPLTAINMHAAQHYIASPAAAVTASPLSTATTTSSTNGPVYDADHTWERAVTASIPDAVEEISIDELHALAQTGHADAMHVCAVNRAEAAIDAAAARALTALMDQGIQALEASAPAPAPSFLPERSLSPLSSPSAQLRSDQVRAVSAPVPRRRSRYADLGGLSYRLSRARTRSRSPEQWRVPSWESYRQRD